MWRAIDGEREGRVQGEREMERERVGFREREMALVWGEPSKKRCCAAWRRPATSSHAAVPEVG